ncbi:hypothetical protein CDD82_7351 [Ophiocordyceps australis]|uniref:Uncharacterized protein n=1 Tax=Ophiocordyceps australis TaxID=1399860 RepID=A0A2C5YR33_9HYPO|nr:hypothetical protein CDD82_7351 [Ophiocordyceps australis]
MELGQTRLRSASHGSLHAAYPSHARHGAPRPSARPSSRRPPLRSVNQNTTLLRCPGPLESMLKTTTETGDIGLFSIKTGLTPLAQKTPRPKHHLVDFGINAMAAPKPLLDTPNPDQDKQQYPFHRDTTSEIISLYGSDNHAHWLTSTSPPMDDAHRSYSMTTCSSRQIPSQKSTATLQSHSSTSGLQRPRSPFPYHTRLKRPGVRPTSPSVAENGNTDYRKAVTLDSQSQRAVRALYRPSHLHGPRRPPPLSLRAEVNRSTASLPLKTSSGLCGYFAQATNQPRSQYPVPPDRNQDASTDYSVRSASLTSIVDMYQRPFTAASTGPPVRSGGSFFYDYTEEFDKPAPLNCAAGAHITVCPIPQRAGGNCRPLILQQDTDSNLVMASDNAVPQALGPLEDVNQIERDQKAVSVEGQQSRCNSDGSIDDVLSIYHMRSDSLKVDDALEACINAVVQKRSTPPCSSSGSRSIVADLHHGTLPPKTDKVERQVLPSWCGARRVSKSVKDEPLASELQQAKRTSQSSMAKLECTLDPALSEFASLFSSLDRLAKTPFSHRDDEAMTTLDGEDEDKEAVKMDQDVFAKRLGHRPSLQTLRSKAMEGNEYRRRHRRNAAAMCIDTTGLGGSGSRRRELSPPREVSVVSPEPISPMKELRVKNSIPRLMKALPPLPWEAAETCNGSGQSSEQSRRCPWSRLSSTDKSSREQERMAEKKTMGGIEDGVNESRLSPPRFKVRVRTLSASRESSTHSLYKERQGCLQASGGSATRPRLKLKLSRSRLGQVGIMTGDGRRNRLKQCNSLADLALSEPKEAESKSRGSESRPKSACGQRTWELVGEDASCQGEEWQQPCDEMRYVGPGRVEKAEASPRASTSTHKAPLSEMRSFSSDVHPAGQSGLRQKLSMLRLRMAGASRWNGGDEAVAEVREAETQERARSTRSERMGGRVRRWASDAKQAVRLYMRKTLDRGGG